RVFTRRFEAELRYCLSKEQAQRVLMRFYDTWSIVLAGYFGNCLNAGPDRSPRCGVVRWPTEMRGFYGHSHVSSSILAVIHGRKQAAFACSLLVALTFSRAAQAAEIAFQSQDGRRIVVAAEARTRITLDGVLDEDVWRTAVPAADFVQAEPHGGDASPERTEVRR